MSRDLLVRHFRQIGLWPVQLMPVRNRAVQGHWQLLEEATGCPWSEVVDEFGEDAGARPTPYCDSPSSLSSG